MMKRIIGFCALSALICIVASQAFVLGQDKVERRDKKGGSIFVAGKILESITAGGTLRIAMPPLRRCNRPDGCGQALQDFRVREP